MRKLSSLTTALGLALVGSATAPGLAQNFVGLNTSGLSLTTFGPDGIASAPAPIVGLSAGDSLIDIDYFTSGNGLLYGMGVSGTLYTLTFGGVVANAAIDSGPVYPPAMPGGPTTIGTPTAIDFNPAADRLRVFSGVNTFRITPGAGTLSADGVLTYVAGDPQFGMAPNLAAAAYINNFDGAAGTTLYSIDATSNSLVVHSVGPQFATLTTQDELQVGGVGAPIDFLAGTTGFDVLTTNNMNIAYVSNGDTIYTVRLNMGMVGDPAGDLTLFTTVTGAGSGITDFAVVIPAPGAAVCGLLGAICFGARRRRSVA